MRPIQILACYILLTLAAANAIAADSPTPAPATTKTFLMPLADGTNATAAFLPTTNEQLWLVYSTPTGQLGFCHLTLKTPTPSPTPGPLPPPPTPPTPPTPPSPPAPTRPLSLIAIGEETPPKLSNSLGASLKTRDTKYWAFAVAQVADPNAPPNALTWIGRTAGKSYPYTFLADANGVILWEGPTPTDDNKILDVIDGRQTRPKLSPRCPDNNCPQTRKPTQ